MSLMLVEDKVKRSKADWHSTPCASWYLGKINMAERSASKDEEDKCFCQRIFSKSDHSQEQKNKWKAEQTALTLLRWTQITRVFKPQREHSASENRSQNTQGLGSIIHRYILLKHGGSNQQFTVSHCDIIAGWRKHKWYSLKFWP